MKPLLIFLATIYLTINSFGLELVKCGSVKIPEGFDTNQLQGFSIAKAKPDGTTLFNVGTRFIVVKPFVGNSGFINARGDYIENAVTNNLIYSINNGVTSVSFTRVFTSSSIVSDVNVIFSTFSEAGFIDSRQILRSRVVEEIKITGEDESRNGVENALTRSNYLLKLDLNGKTLESISIDEFGILRRPVISNSSYPFSYNVNKKLVLPKLNGDSIDFYLVTDPDLFPDTALGSPRVEGGSATFNVTTSSEEPVEIQLSNDLKAWKRIQSLENANGRSVTVPVGSDKEFLRLVEP
jgi:hypothetical protein